MKKIQAAIAAAGAYGQQAIGPRTYGSRAVRYGQAVGLNAAADLSAARFERAVCAPQGGEVEYFTAPMWAKVEATIGAAMASKLAPETTVKFSVSPKGTPSVAASSTAMPPACGRVCVILGPSAEGNQVFWTWFPLSHGEEPWASAFLDTRDEKAMAAAVAGAEMTVAELLTQFGDVLVVVA